jgi:nonsense-mediated mRNA decay protein 3
MRARINIYKDPQALAAAQATAARVPAGMVEGSDDDDEEEALPEIPLDELLDELEGLQLAEGAQAAADPSEDMMSED